MPIMLFLACFE